MTIHLILFIEVSRLQLLWVRLYIGEVREKERERAKNNERKKEICVGYWKCSSKAKDVVVIFHNLSSGGRL